MLAIPAFCSSADSGNVFIWRLMDSLLNVQRKNPGGVFNDEIGHRT
jgi:hypothetical protein